MTAQDTGASATDLFSGGGGASEGMRQAGIVTAYAINHHEPAIRAHERNHPQALHLCTDVTHLDPKRLKRTTILWASASCTKMIGNAVPVNVARDASRVLVDAIGKAGS